MWRLVSRTDNIEYDAYDYQFQSSEDIGEFCGSYLTLLAEAIGQYGYIFHLCRRRNDGTEDIQRGERRMSSESGRCVRLNLPDTVSEIALKTGCQCTHLIYETKD